MKILICCGGGFSSSYVAMRMQKEIEERHLENHYQVDFLPFSLILEKIEEYDVIMLCPHLKMALTKLLNEHTLDKPIYLLPPRIYGMMTLDAIIEDGEDIINLFETHHKNPVVFPGEENLLRIKRNQSYRKTYGRIKPMDIRVFYSMNSDIHFIRETVFMKEQGFQNEFDEIDEHCTFVVLYIEDMPVATCRFYEKEGKWYIGRVCTLKEFRGHSYGTLVMQEAERKLHGQTDRLYLNAQVRASHFYETLGYKKTDIISDDEGVSHVLMYKEI